MIKTVKYYMRSSGIYVRVINDVYLECLNSECRWVPNQEWFVSMFVDGEDEFKELAKEDVEMYINNKMKSKKMIR